MVQHNYYLGSKVLKDMLSINLHKRYDIAPAWPESEHLLVFKSYFSYQGGLFISRPLCSYIMNENMI